jgi:hypothetical protein
LCARFHAPWAAGVRPRLEEHLAGLSPAEQQIAFPELFRLDLSFRLCHGFSVDEGDYLRRFPAFADLIRERLQATDSSPPPPPTAVPFPPAAVPAVPNPDYSYSCLLDARERVQVGGTTRLACNAGYVRAKAACVLTEGRRGAD